MAIVNDIAGWQRPIMTDLYDIARLTVAICCSSLIELTIFFQELYHQSWTPGLVLYISPLRQGMKPHPGHSCCLVWLEATPSQVIYLFVEFWCVVLNITRIERYDYVTTHIHFLFTYVFPLFCSQYALLAPTKEMKQKLPQGLSTLTRGIQIPRAAYLKF